MLEAYQTHNAISPPQEAVLHSASIIPTNRARDNRLPASYAYDIEHARNTSTILSSLPLTDELQLLGWLAMSTTIPVPKLTSHGWSDARQRHFATFDPPRGRQLVDCWEDLTKEARTRTVGDLRAAMRELRSITEAQLPNLGTRDAFLDRRDGVAAGPYATQSEFLAAVARRVDAIGSIYNPGPTRKALGFIDALELVAVDKKLVFTHGNLNPDNIWVDESGKVTAIMDWSQAGYAPAFWEYIKACLDDDDSDVQLDGFYDRILEPWPMHLAVMMHVHDIIW